jgi:hypothetical protein
MFFLRECTFSTTFVDGLADNPSNSSSRYGTSPGDERQIVRVNLQLGVLEYQPTGEGNDQ